MSAGTKTEVSASNFEVESHDTHVPSGSGVRMYRMVDSARIALTALALAAGISILGVSADALAVYDSTHVSVKALLPLWPDNLDIRPTVALVVGSAIVVVTNIVSLLASKTAMVSLHSPPSNPPVDPVPSARLTPVLLTVGAQSRRYPRVRLVCCTGSCLGRRHHRHGLPLRSQRFEHDRFASELGLSMARRRHVGATSLQHPVQAEQGRAVPFGTPRPA